MRSFLCLLPLTLLIFASSDISATPIVESSTPFDGTSHALSLAPLLKDSTSLEELTKNPPSLTDRFTQFLNKNIIFKAVDLFDARLHSILHQQMNDMEKKMLGAEPELLNIEWSDALKQPFFQGKFPFLEKHLLEPLRQRQQTFHDQVVKSVEVLYQDFNVKAEDVMLNATKRAVKEFLALGKQHFSLPAAVNITHSGLNGWIQRKLEEFHATAMNEVSPALDNMLAEYEPQMFSLIKENIRQGLYLIYSTDMKKHPIAQKFFDWVSGVMYNKMMPHVVRLMGLMREVVKREVGKLLRGELYAPFWFLKGDLKDGELKSLKKEAESEVTEPMETWRHSWTFLLHKWIEKGMLKMNKSARNKCLL